MPKFWTFWKFCHAFHARPASARILPHATTNTSRIGTHEYVSMRKLCANQNAGKCQHGIWRKGTLTLARFWSAHGLRMICALFRATFLPQRETFAEHAGIWGPMRDKAWNSLKNFQNVQNFGTTNLVDDFRENFANYAYPIHILPVSVLTGACQCPNGTHVYDQFTTELRMNCSQFAHRLRILPAQFSHYLRMVYACACDDAEKKGK